MKIKISEFRTVKNEKNVKFLSFRVPKLWSNPYPGTTAKLEKSIESHRRSYIGIHNHVHDFDRKNVCHRENLSKNIGRKKSELISYDLSFDLFET